MGNIRYKIVLVDDNITTLTMGRNILKTFYEIYPAPSAGKLFEILDNVAVDLILMDVEMPEMNGYEAVKKLKADSRFADIPVIFLTSKDDESSELEGLDLGAADYVSKPFSAPLLLKRIANHILMGKQRKDLLASKATLTNYSENLAVMVQEKTREIVNLQNAMITTFAEMMEFRDKLTGGHVTRTRLYLKALTNELVRGGVYAGEVAEWDMELFLASAQLHDVGKISVTDLILNKPGPLTAEEFEIMKTHVAMGVDIVEKIMRNTDEHAFLSHALLIVGTHHEKWDGSGYPTGLKGKNIPLEGRLMAIADVYDALITERPYKKPLTHAEASAIIENSAGRHFDPVLTDVFLKVADEFKKISEEIVG